MVERGVKKPLSEDDDEAVETDGVVATQVDSNAPSTEGKNISGKLAYADFHTLCSSLGANETQKNTS